MSQSLKDILKNGEEQFDAQAWTNLSKKLDVLMPVKKTNYFSGKNLLIAGASALFIGSGIFLLMNQSEEQVKQTQLTSSVNQETQNSSTNQVTKEIEVTNTASPNLNSNTRSTNEFSKQTQMNTQVDDKLTHTSEKETEEFNQLVKHESSDSKGNQLDNSNSVFKLPKIEGDFCLNEEISIENTNKSKCYLLNENRGVVAVISGKEVTKLKLTQAGTYYLQYPVVDGVLDVKQIDQVFNVKETKQLSFSMEEEVIYERGIPYILLNTSDFAKGVSWSTSKGAIIEQAEKTKLSAFRKGNYTVSLNFTDENKCEVKKTQSIDVKEDYNLLAPLAFDPSSLDARNNRFMPFALTKRNVAFEMFVLDPENGNIVFNSSSSDNSWDGIDKNTGIQVRSNKAFIWKVSLKNPEPTEKSEYTGTITIVKI